MLLLDLIDDNGLGSGLLDRVQKDISGDGEKKKGIDKYKYNEECIDPNIESDSY